MKVFFAIHITMSIMDVTRALSQEISLQFEKGPPEGKKGVVYIDDLRDKYLQVISQNNNDPVKTAYDVNEIMGCRAKDIKIRVRDGVWKDYILIGKNEGCDIVIDDDSVSRLHATILPIICDDNKKWIVVYDCCSLNGTFFISYRKRSFPGERCVAYYSLERNLNISLKLGLILENVIIEVKMKGDRECIICMDASKSVKFLPCTHFVCCGSCSEKLEDNKCPLCREQIIDVEIYQDDQPLTYEPL